MFMSLPVNKAVFVIPNYLTAHAAGPPYSNQFRAREFKVRGTGVENSYLW
jgi:hypothetical protein